MPDWDKKYAAQQAPFGDAPNQYIRQVLARSDFEAQTALCLADGDGRNGTWLAQQGLTVTSVDISPVATEKARERDRAADVSVERITADLAVWVPPPKKWQAVFVIYLQSEPAIRARALRLGADHLEPGGWLVVEGFAKPIAGRPDFGPDDASVLYALEEVEAAVPDLAVIEAFAGRTRLDEGGRHQGEAEVVRFAARKPDAV